MRGACLPPPLFQALSSIPGVSSERVAHPVLGVSNTLPKQEANAGGSKGGKVVWHCPGTQRSGSLDSRGKVDGEVKSLPLSVVFSTSVCSKVEFDPSFEWNFCVSFSIV